MTTNHGIFPIGQTSAKSTRFAPILPEREGLQQTVRPTEFVAPHATFYRIR